MDYLFIVSVGRSGSTLLQGITNCLERTRITGENGIALPVVTGYAELIQGYNYATERNLQGVRHIISHGKSAVRGLVSSTNPGHPWFGISELNIEALERQIVNIISENVLNETKYMAEYDQIGFKEIRWHYHRKVFQGMNLLFPNAKYIFNYRNSPDIVKSGWWKKMNTEVDFIDEAQNWMSKEAQFLGSRAFEINYEDYVNDPSRLVNLEIFCQRALDWNKVGAVLEKRLRH